MGSPGVTTWAEWLEGDCMSLFVIVGLSDGGHIDKLMVYADCFSTCRVIHWRQCEFCRSVYCSGSIRLHGHRSHDSRCVPCAWLHILMDNKLL